MATVNDILVTKGTHVLSVGREATVLQAALVMNDHKIGALVVLEGGRLSGMFTERDVLRRCGGRGSAPPSTTPVAEVMTSEVACCTPQTTIEEARAAMKNQPHPPPASGGRRGGLRGHDLDRRPERLRDGQPGATSCWLQRVPLWPRLTPRCESVFGGDVADTSSENALASCV